MGVGVNYLEVARQSTGPFSEEAQDAYMGIKSVLDRTSPRFVLEYPCHAASQQRWFQMQVTPLHDSCTNCGVILHLDITQRKEAEAVILESERKFRGIFDDSPIGIALIGLDCKYLTVNKVFSEALGYSPEELSTKTVLDITHPDDAELDRGLALQMLEQKIPGFVIEKRYLRKNGQVLWARRTTSVLRKKDGKIACVLAMVEDITERRAIEERLRQAQKMEAIGQLAGGVAHDFNNLLTVINGYAEILLVNEPQQSPTRNLLNEIREAGERAAALTSQLVAFSRKQVLQAKVVNLNDVIGNTRKIACRMIGEDIELLTEFDPGLGHVHVDPGQIDQIVMNFAVNARDAMPQGGRLTIATRNVDLDDDGCQLYPGIKPGKYVMMSISDTGCGMTPEVKAQIFEPFFTTKEIGKGTGLGLATVYRIVKQSDGYVVVDSQVGVGTTFKVFFPVASGRAISTPAHHDTVSTRRGNETVLLVEDEVSVRKLARLLLEMHGYVVLEASNGQEAIRTVETHQGPIHLLVADVVMPLMSGRQLVEFVRPHHQGLKVLFMSGYTDDAIVRHGVSEAAQTFLHKPFSLPSLAMKVREVLDDET
jgi:two-component system cell cycle sensor histidine kinase/response regulator CckA